MTAILSNAFPFTQLVGLLVLAVAAARATSAGLFNVFCAATMTIREIIMVLEIIDIFRSTMGHWLISLGSQGEEVEEEENCREGRRTSLMPYNRVGILQNPRPHVMTIGRALFKVHGKR